MASPAAVLSILVKTQGAQAAASQLGGIDKSGRAAAGGMSKAESQARRSGKALSGLGSAAKGAGLLLGAAGLAKGFKTAIDEFQESVKVGGQTEAVLKSTGGAAKVTTKHIQDLAGAISKKAGIDDEAIQSSENMLLTFTKVRNETGKGNKIFDQATQVVTDMSVALGQSGKSSAIQLGKALNDPIKGITALRRVGVSFTAEQQKQITTMVKSGDTLGAQKKILKELKTEFGGSAAAQATAADKFKVALNNVAEAAGAVLVPVLNKVMGFLTRFFTQITEGVGVGGALVSKFKEFGGALAPFGQSIQQIVGWLQKNDGVARVLAIGLGILATAIVAVNVAMAANPFVLAAIAIAALVVGVVTAYREFTTFRNVVDAVAGFFKSIWPTVSQAVVTAFNAIKTVVQTVWPFIVAYIKAEIAAITTIVRTAWPIIKAVFKAGMDAVTAVVRTVWPVIKAYFTGGFIAVKGIITGAAKILSGAVDVIKGVLHGDFGEIWTGIKKIFTGAFTAIKGIISGAAHALGAAASAVGSAITGAFSSALRSAAGVVLGFVNGVIDIINKIPGVNIGHVSMPQSLQAASKVVGNTAQGQTHGLAQGGAFGLTGGTVNKPMVMMGEEAPRYPEFVIPTNPAYRKRAQMLLGQAAGSIGGLAKGGVLGAIGGAVSAIAGGAKGLLGKLPGVGDLPSWMKGMGSYVLGKADSFIKDKVTDLIPGVGGGAQGKPGGGGLGTFDGLPVANWIIPALNYARNNGWSGHITSGYRPPGQVVHSSMVAPQGHSNHNFTAYPGGAIDVGSPSDRANGGILNAALAGYKGARKLVWGGPVIGDWGHFSATGHKKGGVIKAFKAGGVNGGGSFMSTSYGPPWGGIQGTGVTATGVDLKNAPQRYGIAVDPSVLSLGKSYYVQPNPFGYKGAFKAFDTGGAIKGNRIDFYDWRGRKAQLGWGRRSVNVSATPSGAGGAASKTKGATKAASGAASTAQKVNPLDQKIASADLAIQQASTAPNSVFGHSVSRGFQQVQALTAKRKLIGTRIQSIRKALKGHLSPTKRLALTQELTQRLQEHAQLGTDIQAIRHPAPDTTADISGGDSGATGDTTDPNQPLIDALQAAADAAQKQADAINEHNQLIADNSAEQKRSNDIADRIQSSTGYQAQKYLADLLSGMVVGRGVVGRSFTPGTGVESAY